MYIALVNLTNGGLSGGSRKYLEVVPPLLARHPRVSRLDVFVPPGAVEGSAANLPFTLETWPEQDALRGFRWLSDELRRRRPDVVFVPNARWLDCGDVPVVVMVRNMEPLVSPFGENPWWESLKIVARAWSARKACRRATRVIAVSQFVQGFLEQRWGLPRSRLATIYHGIEAPRDLPSLQPPAMLRELRDPFLFAAGSIRPYRRLEDVIAALPEVAKSCDGIKLVIAGNVDPGMNGYRERLERLARSLRVQHRLLWTGGLAADEMSWCFSHCAAFVMSSRIEACPNTVLESLAHGCVNVSVSSPPMPEMYGDAARFYDVGHPEQLAAAVRDVLSLSDKERADRQQRAIRLAAEFTWDRTVERTVEQLELAIGHAASRHRRAAA